MEQDGIKCYKPVGGRLQCLGCNGSYIKHGKSSAGNQRYKCKGCSKTCTAFYKNRAYIISNAILVSLLKEGCGIRSIARLLKISCTTVLKRIVAVAKSIVKPVILLKKEYEVDEMRTYYKNKNSQLWIVIALQRETKTVTDFVVGRRVKTTLQKVVNTLLLSNATKIYTDKLNLYSFLIPAALHSTKRYCTNNIERKNLSLRTHLKRLNRRTICYSKSIAVLVACLKIYFWS